MSVKERLQYVWTPEEEKGIALPLTFPPVNEEGIMLRSRLDRYEVYYLTRDECPQSPDEWGDDNLFLVHYHRDFDVRRDGIITEKDAREWYQRVVSIRGGTTGFSR